MTEVAAAVGAAARSPDGAVWAQSIMTGPGIQQKRGCGACEFPLWFPPCCLCRGIALAESREDVCIDNVVCCADQGGVPAGARDQVVLAGIHYLCRVGGQCAMMSLLPRELSLGDHDG